MFVAIVPPASVKRAVAAAPHDLAGARFVAEDQLHLTLRFLADFPEDAVEPLVARLAEIRSAPFQLALGPWGRFDTRVLWLDVDPQAPVVALAARVEEACRAEGVAPETRDFRAHLTVARMKNTSPVKIRRYIERVESMRFPPWPVAAFRLYRSTLGSAGAVHTVVAELPL